MKIFRKILFYLFATTYLILCPLIIFYALGYIWAPHVEEGLIKTGLIHLETLPAGASLSIGGRQSLEKTPATIRNLMAGTYEVKICLPEYQTWSRSITVEPGKAIAFDKILLTPKQFKIKTLIPASFERLWPLSGTRFLLLIKSKYLKDMVVFDWKAETSHLLSIPKDVSEISEVIKIHESKQSTFVLLEVKDHEKIKFFGCFLDKAKPEIKDVSNLFRDGEPSTIQWGEGEPEYLFALYGKKLYRLDLKKMTVTRNWMDKVQGFGLFKGRVYVLRSDTIIRLNENSQKRHGVLVEKGDFWGNLFHSGAYFKIDFLSRHTVCFLGDKGQLFANLLPYRFIEAGLKGYQTDIEGKKIVFWQSDKFGVLDFSRAARKKEIFEPGPEMDWVFKEGEKIEQAYFAYDASHVLWRDEEEVWILPLKEEGRNPQLLTRSFKDNPVFYSDETGRLYYLETSKGYFAALNVLPEGLSFSNMFTEIEKETHEALK